MTEIQKRQHLLSILSRSPLAAIEELWSALALAPEYQSLKAPEIGMAMVRAKAGGEGEPFNMGEMTVTRTVIKLSTGQMGYGYTAGRDKQKSELIAVIDACAQVNEYANAIAEQLLKPLETELLNSYQQQQQKTATSKVNFFTMVRGE